MKTPRSSIAGNMLIYILGAIFLMGLLIVALKGSFQEGSGIDPEKTAMLVGQVQRYGAELERGVSYVLRNGYSETDIRFGHPNSPSYGLITDVPARQVFAPEGGGVEWRDPPAGSQTHITPWLFVGRNTVSAIGTTCAGPQCTDLMAVLKNVTKDFCLRTNDANGINNPAGNPPQDTGVNVHTPFEGLYTFSSSLDAITGKQEGCFEGGYTDESYGLTGRYYYYRVLLAR